MIPIPFLAGAAAAAAGGLFLYNRNVASRAEQAVPVDGQFIEIDGNRLHYVDEGAGPPIVMIHGLAGQMRNFARPLVEALATDHRVIRVDRPGSGYSVRAAGAPATLSKQADTIAAFIRALDLKAPLIVGHSLGGAVALTLAVEHPECVGALALICPLTQDQDAEAIPEVFKGLLIRSPLVRRIVANSFAVPAAMATRDKVLKQIFGPEPVPEDFPTAGGGLLAARPDNFYETSSDLCALEGQLAALVARYGEIGVPVSILYAKDDQLLDPELHGAETARQIEGARFERVDGGHMLPFTQPETTARWIRQAIEARGGDDGNDPR